MFGARTICCSHVVDAETAPRARVLGNEYLVCGDNCKRFIERNISSEEQLRDLLA